jgi:hypothetical protein
LLVDFGASAGIRTLVSQADLADAAVGDLNADGALDVVTVPSGPAQTDGAVTLHLSGANSSLTSTPLPTSPTAGGPTQAMLGDLDADGDIDLLTRNYRRDIYDEGPYFYVGLLNDGRGGFTPTYVPFDGNTELWRPRLLDIDGDGRADIVSGNTDSSSVAYMNETPQRPPRRPRPPPPDDPARKLEITARFLRPNARAGRPTDLRITCSLECTVGVRPQLEFRPRRGASGRVDIVRIVGPARPLELSATRSAKVTFPLHPPTARKIVRALRNGRRVALRVALSFSGGGTRFTRQRTIHFR